MWDRTAKHLKGKTLVNILIPITFIAEQIRIVAKINEVMASCILNDMAKLFDRSKRLNKVFPSDLKNPFCRRLYKVNLYHKTLLMNQLAVLLERFVQRSNS